jgi:predicted lactoylglutathione lyase
MLAYMTFGTNNKEKAVKFYETLLGEIGAKQVFSNERLVCFGTEMGKPMICVGQPYNDEKASFGNGTMVAIQAGSRENVDTLYKQALSLGGTDEGEPGERAPTLYGAYFRDLDGNKIFVCHFG